ncbi:hypothetical protein [Megasphaera sp.]|uniref:hypothetical protein n=1 Tax=Megasphaera sp. TaxID=2023260 RepID=UPI00266EA167|nr:hypothetical protein [uncultured Megasphaera sp.]
MAILRFILRKWFVVLLMAIVVSAGLYIEKSQVAPTIPQSGAMRFTTIVKLNNATNANAVFLNNKDTMNEVTIIPVIMTWGNEQKFMDNTSMKYDYSKLNKNWQNIKTYQDKFKWFNEHFIGKYLGNNIYEFTLAFKAEDLKDSQYLEEHGSELLADYVNYAETSGNLIYPQAKFSVIESHQFIDKSEAVTPATLAKKYAVIGFVIGALVGIAVLCVLFLKKNKLKL